MSALKKDTDLGQRRPKMNSRSIRLLVAGAPLILLATVAFLPPQRVGAAVSERAGAAGGEITFTKDVAPIFFNNCTECHRPGEIAPMSLLSYKDARPWARSIREKVLNREMPPWDADPAHGEFSNNRMLSQKEIDVITNWVDGGSKEGNPADLPAAPTYAQGWSIGKPDVVLTVAQPYTVAASGPDEYQYFAVPTGFTEDRFIRAVEVRPGNRRVVHHLVVFVQPPPTSGSASRASAEVDSQPGASAADFTQYRDGLVNTL